MVLGIGVWPSPASPTASTDSHVVAAKGSLEINYETNEANNDPYPTSLDVTATYTDSAGPATNGHRERRVHAAAVVTTEAMASMQA